MSCFLFRTDCVSFFELVIIKIIILLSALSLSFWAVHSYVWWIVLFLLGKLLVCEWSKLRTEILVIFNCSRSFYACTYQVIKIAASQTCLSRRVSLRCPDRGMNFLCLLCNIFKECCIIVLFVLKKLATIGHSVS